MNLENLVSIDGIGEKTLKDIKRQCNSIEDLKMKLKQDRVALRDDKVELLKKELI